MLTFSTINMAKTMPFSPVNNTIMIIEEVVNYLPVNEQTIYGLERSKKIPGVL